MSIEITSAGPANCAAAVPVITKIPAPITAPMPSIVKLNAPNDRRSVPDSASTCNSEIGFLDRRLISKHLARRKPAGCRCVPARRWRDGERAPSWPRLGRQRIVSGSVRVQSELPFPHPRAPYILQLVHVAPHGATPSRSSDAVLLRSATARTRAPACGLAVARVVARRPARSHLRARGRARVRSTRCGALAPRHRRARAAGLRDVRRVGAARQCDRYHWPNAVCCAGTGGGGCGCHAL